MTRQRSFTVLATILSDCPQGVSRSAGARPWLRFICAFLVLFSWASAGHAQSAPIGPSFTINTVDAFHPPELPPSVAANGGHFVVAWSTVQYFARVRVNQFDALGSRIGEEFTVPFPTFSRRFLESRVAVEANGDFIVQWLEANGDGPTGQVVRAQPFFRDASPRHPAYDIRTEATFFEAEFPGIHQIEDGRFVSLQFDMVDSQPTIIRTSFDRDGGNQLSSQLEVAGRLFAGRIQAWPGTRFLTSYRSTMAFDVHWTLAHDVNGDFIGPLVPQPITNDQSAVVGNVELATDPDGDSIMVWHAQYANSNGIDIWAQRLDPDGLAVGPRFSVNTLVAGHQVFPSISRGSDGRYLIVWESDTGPNGGDQSGSSVRGRWLDANGEPIGDGFQVNDVETFDQGNPRVTAAANGVTFLVTWNSVELPDPTPQRPLLRGRIFPTSKLVFWDRFESGDVAAWDESLP